jgi:hypothetical protein
MSLDTLAEGAGLSGAYVSEIEAARRPRGLSLDAAFRELLGFQGISGPGIEAGRLVSALLPRLRNAALVLLRGMVPQRGAR